MLRRERERRGRRSRQAVLTAFSLDHHHPFALPPHCYSRPTPPSLYTIDRLSPPLRPAIFPFPFLWLSVAPRLLSVSPSANSCATHPPSTSQPLSINSWLPHSSASTALPAASAPSPCPAATILSAQGAVEHQKSATHTQTSTCEPA